MFCTNCGKEIPDKSQFCTNCGRELVVSKKPAKRTNKKLMLVFIIAFLVLVAGVFSWLLLHKPVKTPEQVSQQPAQRKEILDYTKETEVENGLHLALRVDCSRLPLGMYKDIVQRIAKIIANRLRLFYSDEKISFGVYIAGNDGIIVQFPPVAERERILSLIGKTGHIEFKVVSDDAEKIRQALEGNVPQGYELRYLNGQPLLLGEGDFLTDISFKNVFVQTEGQFSQPTVVLEFDSKGAQIFANVTAANVGKRLAIVLDGKVVSAPVIRDTISSGQVQISGFSIEEANDLPVILRVGVLPAPVMLQEERTIYGSIGFDFQQGGILTHVRFSSPITAEDLKNKLDSRGLSGYIQMLERGEKDYLMWLQTTSPAQAEKAMEELFKTNFGYLLRIGEVSEKIKPDNLPTGAKNTTGL